VPAALQKRAARAVGLPPLLFALWKQPAPRYTRGVLAKYAALASSASKGAVTG
jgi:dihydroxyacid dehydratase/phosphogluconate dehydratase